MVPSILSDQLCSNTIMFEELRAPRYMHSIAVVPVSRPDTRVETISYSFTFLVKTIMIFE